MTTDQAVKLAETLEMLMEIQAQDVMEAMAKTGNEPRSTAPAPPVLTAVGTPEPAKLLYNIKEAAAMLRVSSTTITRFIHDGRLRRVPNYYRVLISGKELERFAKTLE